ncbi:glycosyltransferase family A protein, partial [Klebsiella pneumoniae]
MSNKSVSVYIPTHNRPLFLERALQSLEKQTYRNFQVIVSDDGSSVDNFKIVQNIIGKYNSSFSDLVLL